VLRSSSRRLLAALLAALALAASAYLAGLAASPPKLAAGPPPDGVEPGVVLVRFKAGVESAQATGALSAVGATEEGEVRPIRVRKLRVPVGREQEAAAKLAANPSVEFAEVSPVLRLHWAPNDPLYPSQWNLPKINAPQAWGITWGSSGVVVAVIDSGIDVTHADRPASLQLGTDYVVGGGAKVASDPNGHGTHVAGIVAANTNNSIGVAGVAPGVTVLAIRVADADGNAYDSNVAAAIVEAANLGAKVINLSLGGTIYSDALQSAVGYAIGKGVLVVASAGNDGYSGTPVYPAALPGVLAVAATDVNDCRAYYSHVGSYVGVAAPGGDSKGAVLSTYPVAKGDYGYGLGYAGLMGTSMAAPHVSGLAGLIWSIKADLTASEVREFITSTADGSVSTSEGLPIPNDEYGYGRIDAAAAVGAALAAAGVPVPAPAPPLAAQATPSCPRVFLPLVMRSWTTIASQDFEGSFPGQWEVLANGEHKWGKRSCRAYAGTGGGWAVGGGADGSSLNCGASYPNDARSWLVYGPFSLADATAADLTFKLWLNTESDLSNPGKHDDLCRMASVDGQSFYGSCTAGYTGGWIDRSLDLATLQIPGVGSPLGKPYVWVALVFVSDSSITHPEGAYVDDVVVRKCTAPTCLTTGSSALSASGGRLAEVPKALTRGR